MATKLMSGVMHLKGQTYLMTNPPDIKMNLVLAKSADPVESEAGTNYLLAKFTPLIHKLAYQICRKCPIQDMLQSGNYAILKAIKSYNESSAFATWVYTHVRNELQKQREISFPVKITRYLMRKGNNATYTRITDQNEQGYVDDPSRVIIKEELNLELSDALRKLNRQYSKRQCKIFTDYYYLDIPLNTLSKRYRVNANAIVRAIILRLRAIIKDR